MKLQNICFVFYTCFKGELDRSVLYHQYEEISMYQQRLMIMAGNQDQKLSPPFFETGLKVAVEICKEDVETIIRINRFIKGDQNFKIARL